MMNELSDDVKAAIFKSTCVGFGHTKGMPIDTACFKIRTGQSYDLYTYRTIMSLVDELVIAVELGNPLSPCQEYVRSQLFASGVLQALRLISCEEAPE